MLISHRKEFIYTRTGTSASTSVEFYFQPYCYLDGQCPEITRPFVEYEGNVGIVGARGRGSASINKWHGHLSAQSIYSYIGPEIWNRYFKFCTIRNPFDKMISQFYHQTNCKKVLMSTERFRVYCAARGTNDIERFRNYLLEITETNRGTYTIQDQPCVDFFIRYENLHEGVRAVCEKIGIKYEPQNLQQVVTPNTKRQEYDITDFYDRRSIEIIEQLYGWELEHFGYTLPQKQLMTKIEI